MGESWSRLSRAIYIRRFSNRRSCDFLCVLWCNCAAEPRNPHDWLHNTPIPSQSQFTPSPQSSFPNLQAALVIDPQTTVTSYLQQRLVHASHSIGAIPPIEIEMDVPGAAGFERSMVRCHYIISSVYLRQVLRRRAAIYFMIGWLGVLEVLFDEAEMRFWM